MVICCYQPSKKTVDKWMNKSISQLPKICKRIEYWCIEYLQGHVLIADWSVAHFIVSLNDVMNDNMAALPISALVWVRSFIEPDF